MQLKRTDITSRGSIAVNISCRHGEYAWDREVFNVNSCTLGYALLLCTVSLCNKLCSAILTEFGK